jgi:hypothetical protein
MSGANRVLPPKARLAVPLFAGTPLGLQLFAVDHKLLAPPPSQVVPALAGSARIRAQKSSAAPKGTNVKPQPDGLPRDIAQRNSGFHASPRYFPQPIMGSFHWDSCKVERLHDSVIRFFSSLKEKIFDKKLIVKHKSPCGPDRP